MHWFKPGKWLILISNNFFCGNDGGEKDNSLPARISADRSRVVWILVNFIEKLPQLHRAESITSGKSHVWENTRVTALAQLRQELPTAQMELSAVIVITGNNTKKTSEVVQWYSAFRR